MQETSAALTLNMSKPLRSSLVAKAAPKLPGLYGSASAERAYQDDGSGLREGLSANSGERCRSSSLFAPLGSCCCQKDSNRHIKPPHVQIHRAELSGTDAISLPIPARLEALKG